LGGCGPSVGGLERLDLSSLRFSNYGEVLVIQAINDFGPLYQGIPFGPIACFVGKCSYIDTNVQQFEWNL